MQEVYYFLRTLHLVVTGIFKIGIIQKLENCLPGINERLMKNKSTTITQGKKIGIMFQNRQPSRIFIEKHLCCKFRG